MKRRFAYLIIVGMALTGVPYRDASLHRLLSLSPDVDVLVDGTPNGVTFMKGVPTVDASKDGNTLFACITAFQSVWLSRCPSMVSTPSMHDTRPRLMRANGCSIQDETVTIGGWQTSQTEARRFEFTTEARSYLVRPSGRPRNLA